MARNNRYDGLDEYTIKLIELMARKLIGRAGFESADLDDIKQELALDLVQRLTRFDARRANRRTFIARVIEHKVASLVRHQRAAIRDYRRRAVWLEDQGINDLDNPLMHAQSEYLREAAARQQATENSRDLRIDLERAYSVLPSDLKILFRQLALASLTEVSRATGVPRTTLFERRKDLCRLLSVAGIGRPFPFRRHGKAKHKESTSNELVFRQGSEKSTWGSDVFRSARVCIRYQIRMRKFQEAKVSKLNARYKLSAKTLTRTDSKID